MDTSSVVEVREARTKIKAQLTKWMPMEKGILGMVVQHLPSPRGAQESKLGVVCPQLLSQQGPLREALAKCANAAEGPTVAYITKMQPVSSRLYDVVTRAQVPSTGPVRSIAFSRVFSGCLTKGQKVFVMGPKHGLNGQVDMKET